MTTTAQILSLMQVKTLTPDEFDILAQAPDGLVPNPQFVTAVAAVIDGQLQGRAFVCLVPHVEAAMLMPGAPPDTAAAIESELDACIARAGLQGVLRATPVTADLTPYGYVPLPLLLWTKPQQAISTPGPSAPAPHLVAPRPLTA